MKEVLKILIVDDEPEARELLNFILREEEGLKVVGMAGNVDDALEILAKKEKKGRWPLQQKYPGRVYFDLETVGQPCRMNTLRALRVLKMYGAE